MSFKVIKSSFLSTVQDYGRLTHGEHGMSQSGVMMSMPTRGAIICLTIILMMR